ncbi:MAG: hypothetical protein II847_07720 [Ruminobacter sp.]|uniref:hypothetical protein n=1 Tax=Ruminobacter TaxID=866 RepID=UPI002579D7D2|nr:hypothetical protein [Ruminobacter sp.]MBQ3776001.1 hypothetical protein [Ruminobacter sp.]
MAESINYKCPACGGAMDFDIKTHKLKCQFCDSEFTVDDVVATKGAKKFNKDGEFVRKNHFNEPEEPIVRHLAPGDDETCKYDTYACRQCGGEIQIPPTVISTICPYCGNNVVFYDKLTGNHIPDLVVPFKIEKFALKEAYQQHLKFKPFVPGKFKRENTFEQIRGYYIPFWIYDLKAEGGATFKAEREDPQKVSVYKAHRRGYMLFESIPEDSSKFFDDAMTESLEPFVFNDAIPFETEYLSGFEAHVYDESCNEGAEKASNRAAMTLIDALQETVSHMYSRVTFESDDIKTTDIQAQSVLYPIWMLTTKWNGEEYYFAMNAQTGTFVGNLPRNNVVYFLSLSISTLLLGWLFFAMFKDWVALVVAAILAVGIHMAIDSSRVSVKRASKATNYGKTETFRITYSDDVFSHTYQKSRR